PPAARAPSPPANRPVGNNGTPRAPSAPALDSLPAPPAAPRPSGSTPATPRSTPRAGSVTTEKSGGSAPAPAPPTPPSAEDESWDHLSDEEEEAVVVVPRKRRDDTHIRRTGHKSSRKLAEAPQAEKSNLLWWLLGIGALLVIGVVALVALLMLSSPSKQ